jgi:hypothetical protein
MMIFVIPSHVICHFRKVAAAIKMATVEEYNSLKSSCLIKNNRITLPVFIIYANIVMDGGRK